MNTSFRAAAAIVLITALAGCSESTKKTFGLEANPPDAFDVGTQAPLSLPPELGQLPPPNPGQPRPQQVDAAAQGADIVDPQNALANAPAAPSAGGQALLAAAGPTPPAGIRAEVNQNALVASKPPGFVSQLMGNGPTTPPTVDATEEQRRLQENAALGQSATNGSTPQDNNKGQGLLGSIGNFFGL
jgi:hypothetical protein